MRFLLRMTALFTGLRLSLLTLIGAQPARMELPGTENLTINGRPAFLYLPGAEKRSSPQPWVLYAPTLPPYPDAAERWMHEQFLAAGVAVAGIDVGESYGSPKAHSHFEALYRELIEKRGFAAKPCLLARSRGGLQLTAWAIANPTRVAGLAGIYPVFDFTTYPGIEKTAPAYELTVPEIQAKMEELNPIRGVRVLAKAQTPVFLIHGDDDKVVPLKENSAEFVRRYHEVAGNAGNLATLKILPGQGHNMYVEFFHSQELVNFVIGRAKAGAAK